MFKIGWLFKKFKKLSLLRKLIVIAIIAMHFMFGFIYYSEQPGFCNSCHIMEPYYKSWQESTHSEVNCLDCHLKPGLTGHIKGKINGLAQAIDCMVGRVGTKPNATIMDVSCLRSDCHDRSELDSTEPKVVEERGYKFTHEGHIDTEVAGIKMTCGVCHSRFEGEDHFQVNTDICFTCHFLKSSKSEKHVVESKCENCHDIPSGPIQRGDVTIDHNEIIMFSTSCQESCHRKQINIDSDPDESVCLNCHNYRLEDKEINILEMHADHSQGHNKVECYDCHGLIEHQSSTGESVAAMLDCRSCHSNTHEVQRSVYTAHSDMRHEGVSNILSPMFMTHVECNGCHIKHTPSRQGSLSSLGVVAKAVPEACDRCHEEGTGEKYVPFWQNQIKDLYKEVELRVQNFENRLDQQIDSNNLEELSLRLGKARKIMEAVIDDGSWGVHNLKYTESMLLEAKDLVDMDKVE